MKKITLKETLLHIALASIVGSIIGLLSAMALDI